MNAYIPAPTRALVNDALLSRFEADMTAAGGPDALLGITADAEHEDVAPDYIRWWAASGAAGVCYAINEGVVRISILDSEGCPYTRDGSGRVEDYRDIPGAIAYLLED